MESFLRQKLAQAGGSSLQKPVSTFQPIKLPFLSSSFYSISDEPFPQVSGFLDETVDQSIHLNETGTVLNSPARRLKNQTKHSDEGVLALNVAISDPQSNSSLGDGRTSAGPLQNQNDVTSTTAGKVDGDNSDPTISTTSLETSDFTSIELKNGTFNVDLKEISDTGNATVDLHSIQEKNSTFEFQEPKEKSDSRINSTVDIHISDIKTKSGNITVDLTQSHDSKEGTDTDVNATTDIPNLDSSHSKSNSSVDDSAPVNTTTERCNEKLEPTIDIQPQADGSLSSSEDTKMKNTEEASLKVNVTHDIVEQMASAPPQPSSDIAQSSSVILKESEETAFTKHDATTDFTATEKEPSNAQSAERVKDAPICEEILKPVSDDDNKQTEIEMSTVDFVCSVDAPNDSPELKEEEHHKKTTRPGLADIESVSSSVLGNISRNSIFCLDDTLDTRTSLMVTSTPIVLGKESRFEVLGDSKATPRRKRLSVINSIEVQSKDELVGVSNHEGTDAERVTESSSQNATAHCPSSSIKSEPANENKPPTKLPMKRRLPQLSSKLSFPKSSLPPRLQPSINSSVAVPGLQAPDQPNAPSSVLLGNRRAIQMSKGKNMAPVKSSASASTVKTSVVSSVTGYNFTAVAKPSSSGVLQMKPSGFQPPTRKRPALKTTPTTRPSVETIQTQPSNKPAGLQGMRTRNSQLSSVAQRHMNNDGLPLAKRKRIAPAALTTVESDAVHPADEAHESDCVNCLQHQEKLEMLIQELKGLSSECKNWEPLNKKLELCMEEMKKVKKGGKGNV